MLCGVVWWCAVFVWLVWCLFDLNLLILFVDCLVGCLAFFVSLVCADAGLWVIALFVF